MQGKVSLFSLSLHFRFFETNCMFLSIILLSDSTILLELLSKEMLIEESKYINKIA